MAVAPVAGLGVASAAGLNGALRLHRVAIGGGDRRRANTICNDRKSEYESNAHHGDTPRLDFRIFLRYNGTAPGLPNATTGANLV
jgi:hypothetical protein